MFLSFCWDLTISIATTVKMDSALLQGYLLSESGGGEWYFKPTGFQIGEIGKPIISTNNISH